MVVAWQNQKKKKSEGKSISHMLDHYSQGQDFTIAIVFVSKPILKNHFKTIKEVVMLWRWQIPTGRFFLFMQPNINQPDFYGKE